MGFPNEVRAKKRDGAVVDVYTYFISALAHFRTTLARGGCLCATGRCWTAPKYGGRLAQELEAAREEARTSLGERDKERKKQEEKRRKKEKSGGATANPM